MKTIALLYLSGGLLFAAATPADASPPGRYEVVQPGHYEARFERRHAMPRWLRQQRSFRYWYRDSPYQRRVALSWASLYDIYSQERHYARRDRDYRYVDNYYYDRRPDRRRRRH